jgi:DNA-binding NtrC family response regulator
MAGRSEVLVFGCRDDDFDVLDSAVGPSGPKLRTAKSPTAFARDAVSRRPLAIVLGVSMQSIARLDVITVIREVRSEVPVIVIADEDSLDLERSARQRSIFYYLVHPIERSEVAAVLRDVTRYRKDTTA